MNTSSSTREAVWSRYWQSGALHSCVGSYDGNYSGAIAQFWQERFVHMGPGDAVLDIASGNCALGKLLAESATPTTFPTLHAVDISAIRVDWLQAADPALQQRLILHPLTDAANPPLPAASINWAISQFGFEYLDTEAMLAMLTRILSSKAQLAMVLHHADSIITTVARDEVGHLQWLAQQPEIWALAHQMVDLMAMRTSQQGLAFLQGDQGAQQIRSAFNACLNDLGERVRNGTHTDVLDDIARALLGLVSASGQHLSAAEAHQRLDELVNDTQATQFRLDELVLAALTDTACRQLCSMLQKHLGLVTCTANPLQDETHLLAWALVGNRT